MAINSMPTEYAVDVLRALDDGELRSAPALRQLVASAMIDTTLDDEKLADAVEVLVRDGSLERWSGGMVVITDKGRDYLSEIEIGPAEGWIVDDDVVMEYTSTTSMKMITVPVDSLREYLATVLRPNTDIDSDDGAVVARVTGAIDASAGGRNEDDALTNLVRTLREYAATFGHSSPDGARGKSWAAVQLIELSDDAQLRDWILLRDIDETRSRLLRARHEIDAALASP